MSELTQQDFAAFFRALWGLDPFPWQENLVLRLVAGQDDNWEGEPGQWPDVLDLPTGSGKTAALDVAVFHLALEATRDERRAPVRVAFVVDRRLIVDDAYERARFIARALEWSLLSEKDAGDLETQSPEQAEAVRRVRAEPVVKRVALRLRKLAGPDQPPLAAHRLRGGAPLEDDWARTPVQPTILCSTVDQVGSRLLFRGYGVSDRMLPVHAGLLGSDCLVLLDEAHISEPFRQTLLAVERLRAPDRAPFGVALLTATPGTSAARPFGLSARDCTHPILSRRIAASKPARLVEVAGTRDDVDARAEAVVAETKAVLATMTERLINPAVGVVVNRVARARAVFEQLRSQLTGVDVTLIIGPARSVDREDRASELDPIRTGEPRELARPLVVCATQTIEVGVDIDFDALVTEAASLDALRQRFGRLNRAGRDLAPEAVIVAHRDDTGTRADDPVYGDRIARTWEAARRWRTADDRVDFGVAAMSATLTNEAASELVTEKDDAPILLPAYVDLWSQTSPVPSADPEVALFLHGPDRAPSVQIVWRGDIDRVDPSLGKLLALVPPRAAEAVEVPTWAARVWLRRAGEAADFADTAEAEPEPVRERKLGHHAFRWAGEDSERTGPVRAGDLRSGDLVVVPASYGGCDEWGWNPTSSEPVTDVAERAARPYRGRRFAVRAAPGLVAQGTGLAAALAGTETGGARRVLDAVLDLDLPPQLRSDLTTLKLARRGPLEREFVYGFDDEDRPRGVVLIAPRGVGGEAGESAVPATESDELSATSERAITLINHCRDVRAWAESFTARAGLRADQANDVNLAAYLHDAGKADPRFQVFLLGGDPYGPGTDEPLAKSGARRLPPGAWDRAGLPNGWRHEALSVRLAAVHPDLALARDPALVLWLIGTHHGHGRPLFPHADDQDGATRRGLLRPYGSVTDLGPGPGPQSLAFEFGGLDWAQMFEELKRRYGTWGLARLEAFVRLADHRASDEGAAPETVRYMEVA